MGAGIVLDEHLLTNGSRDQDYNGGGELTGERGPLLDGHLPRTKWLTATARIRACSSQAMIVATHQAFS